MDVALQVGQVTEQVKVSADAPVVSVTPTDISGLVGEQQIKDLPLNGRSYDELMTLNPSVSTFTSEKTGGIGVSNSTNANMFSVAGNRPQQNLFLMNGIEFTGAAENNMTPGGTSGQMLGVDAVREFNLLSNSYGAEYGKHPGGQVTIVTTSGHKSVARIGLWNTCATMFSILRIFLTWVLLLRSAAISLAEPSAAPFKKTKPSFSANYEGFRESLHQTSVVFVPDAAARSGAFVPLGSACTVPNQAACAAEVTSLLNLWPVANGPDQGSGIAIDNSNPLRSIREDFGTARVDHNFSNKDSFDAVYTIDDSVDQDATAINPFMSDFTALREQVVSLEETHVVSPSFLNTARFGFSRAGYYFTGEANAGKPWRLPLPFS